MRVLNRLSYYRRIFAAYFFSPVSQLTFWHDHPAAHPEACKEKLGPYYMTFREKADYVASLDDHGVPMLDYHGTIGRQYNPIAVAQYGLGNFNLYFAEQDQERKRKMLVAADWLVANLEPNAHGLKVWHHKFNWEYRSTLVAPWYSGLAQGQGISLLLRAHKITGDIRYKDAAMAAYESFRHDVEHGGVLFYQDEDVWIEEYLVTPPTHILNGFIWALWGVADIFDATSAPDIKVFYDCCVQTLLRNLGKYDTGYWSLYEQSGTRLPMITSAFYHELHIVQLRLMYQMTQQSGFQTMADRWEGYRHSWWNSKRAWVEKVIFKLLYY